jgi:pyruvate dehydrogenase E1 component alpha subunit
MLIKIKSQTEKVWCFLGDMTSETGIAQSCFTYAQNLDLPITFVIEDNNQSVLTNTREVWGNDLLRYEEIPNQKVVSYKYSNLFPHAGAGKRVEF